MYENVYDCIRGNVMIYTPVLAPEADIAWEIIVRNPMAYNYHPDVYNMVKTLFRLRLMK
jgi:hypothetical protein